MWKWRAQVGVLSSNLEAKCSHNNTYLTLDIFVLNKTFCYIINV